MGGGGGRGRSWRREKKIEREIISRKKKAGIGKAANATSRATDPWMCEAPSERTSQNGGKGGLAQLGEKRKELNYGKKPARRRRAGVDAEDTVEGDLQYGAVAFESRQECISANLRKKKRPTMGSIPKNTAQRSPSAEGEGSCLKTNKR